MKHALTAMLLAAGLALTGCGSDDDSSAGSAADRQVAYNDTDVAFATDMIPHHRQAVEMAQLAAERGTSPQVKQLAQDIQAAQGSEIEQLSGLLRSYGEPVPTETTAGGGHGGGHGGSADPGRGTMTAEEMDELMSLSGAAFDRRFLQMMTEHHRGAVDLSTTEIAAGEHQPAIDLARTIKSDQEGEIEEMRALLGP